MGSFSFTCAVSGLPIEAGDKVRFFLVTKSPYYKDGENAVYSDDIWFLRTFPLRGRYNDYGSVEEVEEGPERDLWLEGFNLDLVEHGWGDNLAHDVPLRKGMSFEELLNALGEARVFVHREVGALGMKDLPPTPGIPTFTVIEGVLKGKKLPLFEDGHAKGGFIVDELGYGSVRVRWEGKGSGYGKDLQHLKAVLPHLSDFATMITGGSGPNAHQAELLVRPKPGTEHSIPSRANEPKDPLAVSVVMIREDVWQTMLKMSPAQLSLAKFREGVGKAFKRFTHVEKILPTSHVANEAEKAILKIAYLEVGLEHSGFFRDRVPFTVGLGTNLRLMMEKGPLSKSFVNTVAEFYALQDVFGITRHQWHPSTSVGPQYGEWDSHAKLLRAFASLAAKRDKEKTREAAEDDARFAKERARLARSKRAKKRAE